MRSEDRRKDGGEAYPFVSVIVPVYNAEDTIGECIESLLNQDYPKDRYETIVENGGNSKVT